MDELKSLVEIVSKNKIKQIEIVGQGGATEANWMKLYDGISKDQFESEEDAMNHFFPKNRNQKKYFQRLKRSLKERLLNTLFFIDVNQPSFTDSQKAYYNCYRNSATVKILLGRSGREHAIPLAEKTLKKTLDFEFTDIALSLAKDLRNHYSNIVRNIKKANYFKQIIKKQSKLYLAELKAEEYYSDLMSNFVESKSSKPELAKIASKYGVELREVLKENNSFRLNFISYLIFSLKCEVENDYQGTLEVSEEAISYFENRKIPPAPTILFNFWFKVFYCNLQLGHYTEAIHASKKCLKFTQFGTINWFGVFNYSVILEFRFQNFDNAFLAYSKAIENSKYKKLSSAYREPWLVHEAFIFYFIRIGKIQVPEKQKLKSFRINKFLNEMPTYSKDKYGINITILILHILFLLLDGRYGEIIDRTESLKTYTHRYLRKDHTFRSNCFIKMLMQLPASSFHKEAVVRKAEKYKKKLLSVPLEEANQSVEIEIVPYEMLWEFVLDSLDNKFHHANK